MTSDTNQDRNSGGTPAAPKPRGEDEAVAAAVQWAGRNLPRSTPEIVRAAALEERLCLGLQMLGNDEIAQAMIARFNRHFPFIHVAYEMRYAIELQPMLLSEFRSGHGVHDCFQLSSSIKDAETNLAIGALAHFVVSEDAAFPSAAKRSGYWYARTRTPNLAIYRRGSLSPQEMERIQTYRGLGDPVFRNRLGMLDVGAAISGMGCYVLMTDADPTIWENLVANQPKLKPTGGPLVEGLLAGEYDVAIMGPLGTAVEAAKSGQPVEFVCSSPSPFLYGALGVISSVAPHPNAARLWADWSASKEAFDLFGELTGHISPRVDAERSWAERQPWYREEPSEFRTIDWEDFAARLPDVVARFREEIGGLQSGRHGGAR